MIRMDDTVWVVGSIGGTAFQRPLRLIGKGIVKGMFGGDEDLSTLPILCTVHLTEMYESTSNSRVIPIHQLFKTREGAEQYLFLQKLRDER